MFLLNIKRVWVRIHNFFKRMDEKQVAEILNQKYEGVPPDLIREFYKALQKEKESGNQKTKKRKIHKNTENEPQENVEKQQKKKTRKSRKGKKKVQKERDLTPKNLCNFAIQDDITKFETEMKDLQIYAKDLLARFDNAVALFEEEEQQENEEEEEEEEIHEEEEE